ncbi:hypothetical protein SAMN05216227_10887 [Pseudorhodobacter antarcticus]|uniref:Uncharacterized protein n=1 Tax=Pseudorhodobacter antarcticus TaxID=1077947 RepID=A0A1H8NL38_9RHOB|nr:hypothetical protein SAMN05216227_10887 [Pseudorhodobacter antarcticus]
MEPHPTVTELAQRHREQYTPKITNRIEVFRSCPNKLIPYALYLHSPSTTLAFYWALLHKWSDGEGSPIPGQTYPTTSVMGVPRVVKPFRTATRTWNSAT